MGSEKGMKHAEARTFYWFLIKDKEKASHERETLIKRNDNFIMKKKNGSTYPLCPGAKTEPLTQLSRSSTKDKFNQLSGIFKTAP